MLSNPDEDQHRRFFLNPLILLRKQLVTHEREGGERFMDKKHFTIASLISIVLLTVMFAPTSSLGADYDPWADINEDGNIDIYDIAYGAQRFGTSGDPTKNVNVTNWPVSFHFSPRLNR